MFYISHINGRQSTFSPSKYQELKVSGISPLEKTHEILISEQQDSALHKKTLAHHKNPYLKLGDSLPERKKALIASQIMSAPVKTTLPSNLISEIEKIFTKNRFRHIPVVNQEQQLVGIVSDRDILVARDLKLEVDSVMAKNVITARPETEIRAIAQILFQERIGCMPITNDQEVLVGLITRSDILRTVVNQAPLELWI